MIDVFVRVWPESRFRARLAEAVFERMALMEGIRLNALVSDAARFFDDERLPVPCKVAIVGRDNFAARSREAADRLAESPIYAILDDDHLPLGKTWAEDGRIAMNARPDFAMLSSWSVNGEVIDTGVYHYGDVFEPMSCGTPCFVRKGTFASLPDAPAPEYDIALSEHLKRTVGRIGFLRHVRHNHLGMGFSQVVEGHWGA